MPVSGELRVTTTRPNYDSPLRYPGGKSSLTGFLSGVLDALRMTDATYVEPFAGGAGAGISLLLQGRVGRIVINDRDPAVFAFWSALTRDGERFADRVEEVSLSLDEWRAQRAIYGRGSSAASDPFELGFAFFYLNRTNRSGILNAGVIGGQAQAGRYKLDARFNRERLAHRLRSIYQLRDQIEVTSDDGRAVIERFASAPDAFMYVDPPYVQAGGSLYLNSFTESDHALLATCLNRNSRASWVLTYDDVDLIRGLYGERYLTTFELNYAARNRGKASELMILSDTLSETLIRSDPEDS
ncbi:DNA adenine methylase [Microbacterium arborescens]|uniref:DNA adenine methylase n=1 Tax=Microbacterium arborescens TaxID=33883 RepID=UPI0027D879FF|nr:DNA adenine methylase [Microbacterium arborescens]